MNSWTSTSICFMMPLSCITLFSMVMGCGAVGAPIAPEDVGIEAKVRKQQQNIRPEGTLSEDNPLSVEEDDVELPGFYPIGTR